MICLPKSRHRMARYGLSMVAFVGLAASAHASELITKITHHEILRQVAQQSSVVFIDARELDEFAEERLPGAIQLPLRIAATAPLESLPRDATLVAYCIKDFRGYEVARALQRAGYTVRVMDDPGLQGWKKAKLPTAGAIPKTTDETAIAALRLRAVR